MTYYTTPRRGCGFTDLEAKIWREHDLRSSPKASEKRRPVQAADDQVRQPKPRARAAASALAS